MTDIELAEEIERHLAPDVIYWHWEPSMADMEQIIAALRRGPEREGFYEKLWKDFVSLQRGDAQGILAKVEAYYHERPPSGEMVMVPRLPTYKMLLAANKMRPFYSTDDYGMVYLAMLSAAEAEGRKG